MSFFTQWYDSPVNFWGNENESIVGNHGVYDCIWNISDKPFISKKKLLKCFFNVFLDIKKIRSGFTYHYFKCIVQYIQFSSYINGNRVGSYVNCLLLFFSLVKEMLSVSKAKLGFKSVFSFI